MEKNGTPASPATALASKVLPVPGGPSSSTPAGIRAPSLVKRFGSFKNSTTSTNSCFSSSAPATSEKRTLMLLCSKALALFRPKFIAPRAPPPPWFIIIMKNTPAITSGNKLKIMFNHSPLELSGLIATFTPFSFARACSSDKFVSDGKISDLKFLYLTLLETWNNLIDEANSSLASCSVLYLPVISITLEFG